MRAQIVTEIFDSTSDVWVGDFPYLTRREFLRSAGFARAAAAEADATAAARAPVAASQASRPAIDIEAIFLKDLGGKREDVRDTIRTIEMH